MVFIISYKRVSVFNIDSVREVKLSRNLDHTTNHYIVRGKHESETQYESLRSAVAKTMQRKVWMVQQVNFVTATWSLNEEELKTTWKI